MPVSPLYIKPGALKKNIQAARDSGHLQFLQLK